MIPRTRVTVALVFVLLVTSAALAFALVSPKPGPVNTAADRQLTSGHWDDFFPTFSPDGKTFVFSSNQSGDGFSIWKMNADTGRSQFRLTHLAGDQWCPGFSPDGRLVSFVESQSGSEGLWTAGADGRGAVMLAGNYSAFGEYEWSPDGGSITYAAQSHDGGWNIFLAFPNGTSTRELTNVRDSRDPSWSTNGKSILFASNRYGDFKLFRLDLVGGTITQLTSGRGNDTEPRMSPDGKQIAFLSDREGGGATALWISDAGGANVFQAENYPSTQAPGNSLPPDVAKVQVPQWNPRGNSVLFFSSGRSVPGWARSSDSDLYVFYENIDVLDYTQSFAPPTPMGGHSLIQTVHQGSNETRPQWGPLGDRVLYVSDRDGFPHIWMMLTGTNAPKPYGG